jgi:hypothetical protein
MQDYFFEEGPTTALPLYSAPAPDYSAPTLDYSASAFTYPQSPAYNPAQDDDEDFQPAQEDEVTRRIREEEEAQQRRLREKADEEYRLKLQRKEEGRRQLEEYLAVKERDLEQRKRDNIESEERLVERTKKESAVGGWAKVAGSIATKQGERTGKKDLTRMREAILHRREDEK